MNLNKELKISQLHPCFGSEAHNKFGRLHLPVSSSCNIKCRFCTHSLNITEQRPGVANKILKSNEVLSIVKRAISLCPEITVVGIAGPGDTLASDEAIKTFEIIDKEYPLLIKCMSTNGLLLSQKAEQLAKIRIKTLTVTVNAIDPEILTKIVSHIIYEKKYITGIEMAEILINKQLEGIKKMSRLGATIKVNTVLIPKINDKHIKDIAKTVKDAGASIYNIIPLIPQGEFVDSVAPDCNLLNKVKKQASQYLEVFHHCKHCRADACGIPGKNDFSKKLYEYEMETFSHG